MFKLPSKIYVLDVVDNRRRPSASCSAHTGVAGSGAARHTLPSQGARREPPHPKRINSVTATNIHCGKFIILQNRLSHNIFLEIDFILI